MKIGILGGGQLGRMFIQEALKYDDEFYSDSDNDAEEAEEPQKDEDDFD